MAQEDSNAAQENDNEAQQPGFSIEKIYLKDASLEIPNAPQIFTERTQPQVGIELSNVAQQIEAGVFEVAIKVTVTSKIAEKTVFLAEVTQAGIFQIRNVPEENIPMIVGITCPNILFPYARESISDLTIRGGFQPVLLNPINFEALFAQQQQQQAVQADSATH
ncbi:MAG: protein-export chaperone SecB [Betaproteobacteria bacterium HGW-Betaproteobacteria-22]|nr:MAG: protein-export chaperone SecB [Betaproteobacteria bacterium HGW-Betaproteobacteria-22]